MVTNSPSGFGKPPVTLLVNWSTKLSSSPNPRNSAAMPLGDTWAAASSSRASAFSCFLSTRSAIMDGHLQFVLKIAGFFGVDFSVAHPAGNSKGRLRNTGSVRIV